MYININLFSESRVALLIANGAYKNFSSLSGPTIEAEALTKTLTNLGFDVKLLKNATREQILDELDNLKKRVNGKGGVAFFHYGGHGVQVNGSNYLIPVDADIPDEKKVTTRAVNIDEVMSSLDSSGSDTNIVVLDACRNNPLPAGSGRSASRGLTVVGLKPKNSIIVYSAEAGTVAQDGLFTPTLTKYLQEKNISFSDVLLKVRSEVNQKSSGSQIPGEYNQLFNNVFLNGFGAPIVINTTILKKEILIDGLDELDKISEANLKYNSGDYNYVIEKYKNINELTNIVLLKLVAQSYDKIKDWKNVIKVYNQLISIDEKNSDYYKTRGNMYFNYSHSEKIDLYDYAIKDYTKAIELNPVNSRAYLDRSQSYRCVGKNKEALADCISAEKITPNDDWVFGSYVWVYLALRDYINATKNIDIFLKLTSVPEGDRYLWVADWYSEFDNNKAQEYYRLSASFGNTTAKNKLK